MELYDFTLFAFFSIEISKSFFPNEDPMTALLLALSTFGVGFVTRPVGGILFGSIADRRGRSLAITITMGLMSLGTGIVAVCPSYDAIGLWAPSILVLGRLVQGLGIGGEVGPTATLLFELGGDRHRVLFVSLFMASQGAATLLGGLTGLVLDAIVGPEGVSAWAWWPAPIRWPGSNLMHGGLAGDV